jgi:hypothetical protein
MPRGDDDTGDELGSPWPARPYAWPAPEGGLVHGVDAVDEFERVGAAAKKAAGPTEVTIKHTPKHGKNPPWLTWGNNKVVSVTGLPLVDSSSDYVQLVNVRYGRPESWRFFLAAQILGNQDDVPHIVPTVEFQLTIGTGFTTFTANFFQTLQFEDGANSVGDVRMCTTVQQHQPNLFFIPPATQAPNLIEVIPAQDLYIAARVVTEGSIGAGNVVTMGMTAMVTPNVHVRPGWHLDIFAGGEENY